MTPLLLALVLSATPALESRLFIATGAKTEAEAKRSLTALKVPEALGLRKGFPRVIDSGTVPGLNPGFWLVVLGACSDAARWTRHNDGLAALIQRGMKGAYAKPVGAQDTAGCPLWVEGGTKTAPALTSARDDLKALKSTAAAMHKEGNLLGADGDREYAAGPPAPVRQRHREDRTWSWHFQHLFLRPEPYCPTMEEKHTETRESPAVQSSCRRSIRCHTTAPMASTEILTLRLDPATSRRLSRLSKATDRTKSRLAAEAISRFLDENAWQVAAIEAGVRAADAGDVASQAAVEKWVKSWGKPRELKRPR